MLENFSGTWSGEAADTVGAVFRHCERLNRWKVIQTRVRGTRVQRKRWAMEMYRQLKGIR